MGTTQMSPGMTIQVGSKLYRVESAVRVKVAKGKPFIKTKLCNLATEEVIEKNFKPDQAIKEVKISEATLEFLYLEGDAYLFLDINSLEKIPIKADVIGDMVHYLKEGLEVKSTFYGDSVFSVELPMFLELVVSKMETAEASNLPVATVIHTAILETGAKLEVPSFIEVGDIVKIDTRTGEFIQRV